MTEPASETQSQRWLLLIHQIPPKPDYLRVKIGRRLQRIGAVAVKNSVYVLPASDETLEDFQWVRREVIDGGGDASICEAAFIDGLSDDQLRHVFRAARNEDYAEIAAAARELHQSVRRASPNAGRPDEDLARLKKRLAVVAAVDFFAAPERAMAEESLDLVDAELTPRQPPVAPMAQSVDREGFTARTWVTRREIFVDRMASAWLIRRFIDPQARFKFVRAARHRPTANEVRFDMFEAEFTHEGDRCTFETLVDRFGLADDSALQSLAEIVHDIDMKDAKFARDEAAGIERVLAGIAAANADDAARLERSAQLFDELYALFSSRK